MPNMMKSTEKALHKQSNKMLVGATKRYKRFMRQAAKAASDHKREEEQEKDKALVGRRLRSRRLASSPKTTKAIEPECGLIALAINRWRLRLVMHEQR